MAQVYENSLLTIGAAISKDDTDSLFFEDKKRTASLRSHVGRMKDGAAYTIYSRLSHRYHPTDGFTAGYLGENYPLMSRAWVYQERLLAPRILYFGEELSWECRQSSACECSEASQGIKSNHSSSPPDLDVPDRNFTCIGRILSKVSRRSSSVMKKTVCQPSQVLRNSINAV
ncbi:unnamed protein product [Alternaria alternata]